MSRLPLIFIITVFLCSCNSNSEEINTEEPPVNEGSSSISPNILLIIADDFGLDACPAYNLGSSKPNMPILQNLMDNGIRFTNVWSNPTCSPTRAGILTGKYGFRTGVVKAGNVLSTSETTLQSHIDTNTNNAYSHAVIGKWHLGRTDSHPNNMGLSYFAGTTGNVTSYTNWELNINGTTSNSTEYLTSKLTDLAIDWIDNQTKPWFLWLAYNAPHSPLHLAPTHLHSQGALPADPTSISNNPMPYYLSSLEALDTEMGRLINAMSAEEKENTIFIFVGDNGTPGQVVQDYHNRRAKGTVYQGGVNVPMIVSGKNVNRVNDTENALINTTDLFATIADICGTNTEEINDSKSFKDLFSTNNPNFRDIIYTENLNDANTKDVAIRNTTHKYILFGDGSEALFNLEDNPLENPNLLSTSELPLSSSDSAIRDELASNLNTIID